MMREEYPVYWLGGSFQRLAISRVVRDPSGGYEIQYGNCLRGGQSTCVTPLQIVTSPDNSFLPGSPSPRRPLRVRGVRGLAAEGGRALALPTGPVVVDLYAESPALARAAAAAMVAIGSPGLPGTRLPAPLPDTGFAARPLPTQQPPRAPAGALSALRAPSAG